MKHTRNAVQLLVLFALGAAVVLSVVLPQLPFVARESEPVEITVILRQSNSSAWSNARLGMEQAAGSLRAELRLLTITADNDADEQAQLMLYEAGRGADALVVVPAGCRLPDAGVPLVTLESVDPAARAAVCPDNEALGRALAAAALADDPAGEVLLVTCCPDSDGAARRLAAARDALEAAGVPVRQVDPGRDAGGLEALLSDADAAAALLLEPQATEAAAELKERLALPIALYGVGSTGRIAAWLEKEVLNASAVWSDFAAGYLAVERAVNAARGQACADELLEFVILRGEDIYAPDNQKLLFPVAS